MADTNSERVGKALALLTHGLAPFVDRELKKARGASWENGVGADGRGSKTDAQFLLKAMIGDWRDVFQPILGHPGRNWVGELIDVRNNWAHQEAFSSDQAYRALDTIELLLQAVSAGEQAVEVGRMKHDLQRRRYTEEARRVTRRQTAQPLEGMPSANLKPWRMVVTPHPDVQAGSYQQAEFAADLHQVWRGEAEAEYGDAPEFFRRTFLTEGLRDLLLNAAKRLRAEGGDPIVQLQTNFGGGKTHSLIALYHLGAGIEPAKLPGVEEMLANAAIGAVPEARRAVLVGHQIDPGSTRQKDDGTVVRTMWGELAWQLLGAEGYALVANADEARTSPGERLTELLKRASPCLVLIDEWVAYARQLYGREDLLAGTFDTQMTFAQALSDAAKNVKDALLVVSIPASDIEVGGEAGRQALERLSNVFMRQETSWKPASAEEGFEIVRRRLFEDIPPDLARERDAVVGAFAELYAKHTAEFPSEVREASYRRRLEAAYPIHPELFDQLFESWSTLEKFQRTRGVLRLMAAVIHELWSRDDNGLLIMPASIPMDAGPVQSELTRYLDDAWTPVIASDIDGENAVPIQLDAENANFKRFSATRRVARTVYIGSAPTLNQTNKGIDDTRIKLGSVQPGESPAVFGDALRRLSTKAMYLVEDHGQYWYALGQTVSRTAADRKESRFLDEHADEEIVKRLRAVRGGGDFAGVHWAPRTPGDVPDTDEARLVVLGPEFPYASGTEVTPGRQAVEEFLKDRAGGPRANRNMLVFVVPDTQRLAELRDATRAWLAWRSVVQEKDSLNLDIQQTRHAETQASHFEETVNQRIGETFIWLLVPKQTDPKSAEVTWDASRVTAAEPIPDRVSRKLKNEEGIVTEYAGSVLRLALDRIPLWRGDHVSTKQLWEDFAKYLYLPRLRNRAVLIRAIETGIASMTWEQDAFAYADAFDEGEKRYLGLVGGRHAAVLVDASSVVVKPEVARAQIAAEAVVLVDLVGGDRGGASTGTGPPTEAGEGDGSGSTAVLPTVSRRFFGSVHVDATRMGRDASQIADEVVAHLSGLVGANVEVRIEISAERPAGFEDDVMRTVTENAATLKFDQHAFEEE